MDPQTADNLANRLNETADDATEDRIAKDVKNSARFQEKIEQDEKARLEEMERERIRDEAA